MTKKLNPKVIAINGCHDASVTFVDRFERLRIFEYERFCKIRYGIYKSSEDNTILGTSEKTRREFWNLIQSNLLETPEVILFSELDYEDIDFLLKEFFPNAKVYHMGHHMSHCAGAYYQSGFDNAVAFSFDGGGKDYVSSSKMDIRSYSFYFFDDKKDSFLTSDYESNQNFNPGIYGFFGFFCKEISKNKSNVDESEKFSLSYAGKMMGLSAYGKIREEWIGPIRKFYSHSAVEHTIYSDLYTQILSEEIEIELYRDCLSGQDSYDLAATNQFVFEQMCFEVIKDVFELYSINTRTRNVVFSGGCALNVLFNQKLKEFLNEKNFELYIPPNPGDDGLSFGHYVYYNQLRIDPTPYCGIDILDRPKIYEYSKKYFEKEFNDSYQIVDMSPHFLISEIVDLITSGKIGALMSGCSEVGPRALGNRSIICDPSFPEMKDILNSKVKFREWFRPFAPVCIDEMKDKYFENAFESEYMSYAPTVRKEYRKVLSSITHVDNTARLQTVTKEQHSRFYDILNEMRNRNKPAVILNTSFNIKGKPILSTVEDAFYVLENTQLDFLVIEGILFKK